VQAAAGFTAVFDAIRECRRPAVGHNPWLDLGYCMEAFVGPLPPSWAEYKEAIRRQFPGSSPGRGIHVIHHFSFPVFFLYVSRTCLLQMFRCIFPSPNTARPHPHTQMHAHLHVHVAPSIRSDVFLFRRICRRCFKPDCVGSCGGILSAGRAGISLCGITWHNPCTDLRGTRLCQLRVTDTPPCQIMLRMDFT
jgi:hypothetical protein